MSFKSKKINWIVFFVNRNKIINFESFGVEHIPKEILKVIGNIYIITNICWYFCIEFIIDFMLKRKSFQGYTTLFLPNDDEKNDKMTLTSFQ